MDDDGVILLDGGLATELERRGHDLDDSLWSARLLHENPDEIRAVHRSYLQAGADIVTTASYQATIPGLMRLGPDRQQACDILRRSVQIARLAVSEHSSDSNAQARIAASIGPYGAYLANGAEYTGDYGLDVEELIDFHRERWHILASQNPDFLLCETLPSLTEVRALMELSGETKTIPVWFSFSCRNDRQICDGTEIEECVRYLDRHDPVAAIGINCTAPRFVPELIRRIRNGTRKPIIVYPNSGEAYDAGSGTWSGETSVDNFAEQAQRWRDLGARIIGGCCRTSPQTIAALRRTLF